MKKDKYIIVEYMDNNNAWTFFAVYKNATNIRVLKHYAREHGLRKEDITIEHSGGESYLNDEVRAYEIVIEEL